MNVLKYSEPLEVQFELVWTAHSPGAYFEEFQALGVPIHQLRDSKYHLVRFTRQLCTLLRQRSFDAVCGFCPQNIGRVMLAAHSCGVPARLACYRSASMKLSWNPVRSAYMLFDRWLALKYASRIVGNSSAVLDAVFPNRDRRSDRYQVWPNGVDLEAFAKRIDRAAVRRELGLRPTDLVVGHIGRFEKMKNHRTVIAVASILAKRFERLRLLLVGDGPLRASIIKAIKAAGMAGRAVLPGARSDIPEMLSCMDLIVFPSLHEGCPNALLEAMAAGVPFVGSDIAANAEAVPEVARQYLAPAKDADGLASLAMKLLSDEKRRSEFIRACRNHVNGKYSIRASVRRFLEIIRQDVNGP